MKLTAPSLREWDSPEKRAVYWAGAGFADGLLRDPGTIESESLTDTGRAWYTLGGIEALDDVLDALPDSVVEQRPGGLKSLQNLRRAWIKRNSELGDDYARRIGLLK